LAFNPWFDASTAAAGFITGVRACHWSTSGTVPSTELFPLAASRVVEIRATNSRSDCRLRKPCYRLKNEATNYPQDRMKRRAVGRTHPERPRDSARTLGKGRLRVVFPGGVLAQIGV
jgi:hypothetical protein